MDALVFHDIRTKLIPMLRKKEKFDFTFARERVREYLGAILQLDENDKSFLSSFAKGEYRPELLFDGYELACVADHPMAMWKMQNRK
jgi:hypothetical protein